MDDEFDDYDDDEPSPDALPQGPLALDWRLVVGGVLECVSGAIHEVSQIPMLLAKQLVSDYNYRRHRLDFIRASKREIDELVGGE
jgi:hypothetical protein